MQDTVRVQPGIVVFFITSLEWRHMRATAAQISSNSTICSTVRLGYILQALGAIPLTRGQ